MKQKRTVSRKNKRVTEKVVPKTETFFLKADLTKTLWLTMLALGVEMLLAYYWR